MSEDANDNPTVDLSLIKTFSGGDGSIERELIGAFIKQSDKGMKILAENRLSANEAWRGTAHLFKGGASSLGAKKLEALCEKAENNYGTAEETSALFEKIEKEYDRVKAELEKIMRA
jgi:HPt (histidine-containing phosphotransfer) domain-containing protein